MTMPLRAVMATSNTGKLREISEILVLAEVEIAITAQSEFGIEPVDETGTTFLDNALLKAKHAATATGLMAIADDSGLAVDALDGAPGVHSARFAGLGASDAENVALLIKRLGNVVASQRAAAFHCVAVAVFPNSQRDPLVAKGVWKGSIASAPNGSGGFGYDPVFYDNEAQKCAAELTAAQKNQKSHRGQAFRQLAQQLSASLNGG